MKQKIKEELNNLDIKSEYFLNKYINFCIENSNSENYDCIHHILPKSKSLPFVKYSKLSNTQWNASYLTYKNHFIAHYLLVMAIKHKSISFAFTAMKNKDIKNGRIDDKTIELFSSEYDKIKKEHSIFMREVSKNKAVVIDENKNTVRISKEEYATNKNKYTTHSTAKFNVTELSTGLNIRIHRNDYDKNLHSFHLTNTSLFYNILTGNKEHLQITKKTQNHIHVNTCVFIKRNGVIGEIKAKDILFDDEIISLTAKLYRSQIYTKPKSKGTLMEVYDLYEHKLLCLYTNEIDDYGRYFNITYKKMNSINVICKKTFKTFKLQHYSEFNKNSHFLYNKKTKYYINIDTKELLLKNSNNSEKNYVIYSKRSAHKYLNENIDNYVKSEGFISPSKNKVTAFDIILRKNVKVDKDIFDKSPNLIGIMNSIAVKMRKENENKQ